MKKEDMSKVFSDEEEFEETYVRFLGNLPPAGKRILDSHEKLEACFLGYLDAFERWVFRHAYESGYAAAMEGSSRGPVRLEMGSRVPIAKALDGREMNRDGNQPECGDGAGLH